MIVAHAYSTRRSRYRLVLLTARARLSIALGCFRGRVCRGAKVYDYAADHAGKRIFALLAVVRADRRQRVSAARQAVTGKTVGDRAGDGDVTSSNHFAIDEQLARSWRSLAKLEIRRSGDLEVPAQVQLTFGNLALGDDLVLVDTEVVVGELQLLLLVDKERVAAKAGAVG